MTVTVVGLGKIGLPLACQFASMGEHVIGADIDDLVVELVSAGKEPFPGEEGLGDRLADVVGRGLLTATTDTTAAVAKSDTVVVVVPVVVDEHARPDLRGIDSATNAIAAGLQPGTLVSYETTLPVRTTRRFQSALEAASGLKCGTDFFVCHSPERVLTGRVFSDLRRYPKLVGGVDLASASKAVSFYERVLEFDNRPDLPRANGVWDLGSAEAAELAKLAETTYRNINIAFANELALHADTIGVDVQQVIDASNSQPYSHIHRPGIAVGGHCIPVYPKFYLSVDTESTLPATAITVNESMPRRVAERVRDSLGDLTGSTVAILGISYRGGVKETAFSGAFPLRDDLESLGATVVAHDPMYSPAEIQRHGFTPFSLGSECDAAVVQADHLSYRDLAAEDLPAARMVFDGRRILDPERIKPIPLRTLGDGQHA